METWVLLVASSVLVQAASCLLWSVLDCSHSVPGARNGIQHLLN